MNPVMEGFLGGWRIVGINTATSGVPINLCTPRPRRAVSAAR